MSAWRSAVSSAGDLTGLPQRLAGRAFCRLYVRGGRYACYNQSPYVEKYPGARARSTGFDWTLFQVMISDPDRLAVYRRDIARTVSGRRVLEVGPGPVALLTRMAVSSGAREIVSVEGNPWVADSAARRLRRAGVAEDRARVVAKYSDDLTADDVGGNQHFDVLLIECYHAVAAQERVVETIATLRANGFSFGSVISRGFVTYVAPAAAPPAARMTGGERVGLGWAWDEHRAGDQMRRHPSSLHGDHEVIEAMKLAPGQDWQRCDFETTGDAATAAELSFDLTEPDRFAGFLFWNEYLFHDDVLDTGATPTGWGVYFVPTPLDTASGGAGELVLHTELADPQQPSAVSLVAELGGSRSEPQRL